MNPLIPIIDLNPLLKENKYQEVALNIEKSLTTTGCFYIKNYGINELLINEVFECSKQFFNLSLNTKLNLDSRKSNTHRGYFPIYAENTNPSVGLDYKEGFDIMLDHALTDKRVIKKLPFHGKNIWPQPNSKFEIVSMKYYFELVKLAHRLMETIAVILSLPKNYFLGNQNDPFAMLRMLRYPPKKINFKDNLIGAEAHTDYGLITILKQSDVGGLEIQKIDGKWIPVPPINNTLLVNLGDEIARWTNNKLLSTTHRVINKSNRERYSSVFFFHTPHDRLIECIPSCITKENPASYKAIKAIDYMQQRFTETFIKK